MVLWFLYNVAFLVAFILCAPHYLWRMWRRGGYRPNFMDRFGVFSPAVRAALESQRRIWIHGVSVGEIFVVLRFIEEFKRRDPSLAFVVTTTTSTGHKLAAAKIGGDDILLYFPTDFPWVVRRVLDIIRPRALILAECELWPNLIHGCIKDGVPVILVNGRISRPSYWGYRQVRFIARRVLSRLSLLLTQTEDDRRRLIDLGARPDAVRALGTVKYDLQAFDPAREVATRALIAAAGIGEDAVLLLGGSTWPGEEAALMRIYKRLKPAWPNLRLVLVPRHAERRAEVEAEIRDNGLVWVRRTDLGTRPEAGRTHGTDVLLVDSTGELRDFYACAQIAFVGKSLTEHGGQNLIEPAALAKPIIVGPNMENFTAVMPDFLKAEALLQVQDEAGLEEAVKALLSSPERRAAIAARAGELVRQRSGVVEESVQLVLDALRHTEAGAKP